MLHFFACFSKKSSPSSQSGKYETLDQNTIPLVKENRVNDAEQYNDVEESATHLYPHHKHSPERIADNIFVNTHKASRLGHSNDFPLVANSHLSLQCVVDDDSIKNMSSEEKEVCSLEKLSPKKA
ncbi:MAG: hypothetical protein RLZ35_419 [Pseudomonadota bacterium]|jgi:hypothetical protein